MTVRFYVPYRREIREPLPARIEDYWPWLSGHRGIAGGKYSWTLQTYFYLQQIGFACELVRDLRSGVVVAHRDFLSTTLVPRPDVYLVCIKPDRREHTWAHYYVVQNQNDRIFGSVGAGRAKALPYWPQPALMPRDEHRGATCENVAYYGRQVNLAEELKSPGWAAELRELGLNWRIVPHDKWNDYRDCDVSVAVRGFTQQADPSNQIFDPNSKPPSKLVNSWLAGVPAVLGAESSFRDVRRSSLDFVEVRTVDELRSALRELKSNEELYRAMVSHGRARAREFSPEAVALQWKDMLLNEIGPAYDRWMRKGSIVRQAVNLRRTLAFFANRRNLLETRIHWRGALR